VARRVGDRAHELAALTGSLTPLVTLGRWEDSLARAREAIAAEELASLHTWAPQLLGMTSLHVRRGDLGEARLLLEPMQWAEESEDWQGRAAYAEAKAEVLRAEDRPAEALAAAAEVLATRTELELGLTNGFAKRGLVNSVEAVLDLGDSAKADELLGMVRAAQPGQVTPWLRA